LCGRGSSLASCWCSRWVEVGRGQHALHSFCASDGSLLDLCDRSPRVEEAVLGVAEVRRRIATVFSENLVADFVEFLKYQITSHLDVLLETRTACRSERRATPVRRAIDRCWCPSRHSNATKNPVTKQKCRPRSCECRKITDEPRAPAAGREPAIVQTIRGIAAPCGNS
jgi:hypothetical protein